MDKEDQLNFDFDDTLSGSMNVENKFDPFSPTARKELSIESPLEDKQKKEKGAPDRARPFLLYTRHLMLSSAGNETERKR